MITPDSPIFCKTCNRRTLAEYYCNPCDDGYCAEHMAEHERTEHGGDDLGTEEVDQ